MTLLAAAKYLMVTLPILVGQWFGILGLLRTERSGARWCMFSGVLILTVTIIIQFTFGFLMSSFSGPDLSRFYAFTGYSYSLGNLLFAVGFAIHGSRSSRMRQRIEELEMMNLAQATELERLRNR